MKIEKFLGGVLIVGGLIVAVNTAQAQSTGTFYSDQAKELKALTKKVALFCGDKLRRPAKLADKDPNRVADYKDSLETCAEVIDDAYLFLDEALNGDENPDDGEEDPVFPAE